LIEPHKFDNNEIRSFYVSKTPVHQEIFEKIMGFNPSIFKGNLLPVENISWYEALTFCNLLSYYEDKEPVYTILNSKNPEIWKELFFGKLPNHRVAKLQNVTIDENADGYRLLTNVEWNFLYDNISNEISDKITDYAWIFLNSENKTHEINSKFEDNFGLSDFLGNVLEWRIDHYGNINKDFYEKATPTSDNIFSIVSYKIFTKNDLLTIRTYHGFYNLTRNSGIGFRVCRSISD
jgi:formylglycine-generating enzyme required for sulfatase activity